MGVYDNFHGKKGRSGRKTQKEETQAAIEMITEEALINLARSKVGKHLNKELNFKETKEMALPIVVKGMAQKIGGDKENPLEVIAIYGNRSVQGHNSNQEDIQPNQENQGS